MSTIMKASHQWATRPDDERYVSLIAMRDHFNEQKRNSRQVVVPSKTITLVPQEDHKGITVRGDKGHEYSPNHWSFGQLAQLSESPAGYLRTLPAPIATDAINYKLKFVRAIEDVGLLLYKNGTAELRSANGPNYGRIWNADICDGLVRKFGDGVTGDWRVPGEFGKAIEVTKANTTLYASDRDMFVFLADEVNRIEVPNRRNGQSGSLARGFYLWNSETGSKSLGIGTFLFDYVCCNRIIWGAEVYEEIRIRHTASAPLKWLEEVQPVLQAYHEGSSKPIQAAIVAAQQKKIDDVDEFLSKRFGKRMVSLIEKTHEVEEGRPIETIWDASTAITAYARGLTHQDARVDLERAAGDVMQLAA
jgi:hypothetical protein